jgi:hypothetical protein
VLESEVADTSRHQEFDQPRYNDTDFMSSLVSNPSKEESKEVINTTSRSSTVGDKINITDDQE